MDRNQLKTVRRNRRRRGLRKRIIGTTPRPRLAVFRSSKHIYVQLIDDMTGNTLACAGSLEAGLDKGSNVEAAKKIGTLIAEKAKAAGISQVAFDRGGFRFHGRVKALADAAREGGLKF